MQICGLNFYNPVCHPNFNFSNKQTHPIEFCGLEKDVFEKSKTQKETLPVKEALFGVDKTLDLKNTQDINDISEDIKTDAKTTVDVGFSLKRKLDEKYGENNYVFVSIGKKPAGAAKVLEIMGQDVRYLPISDISNIPADFFEINPDNVKRAIGDKHKDYLDCIGINADKIKHDKRHYIFCDYRYGTTEEFMKTYIHGVLNLPKENASFEGLEDILNCNANPDEHSREKVQIKKYINDHCRNNNNDDYNKFGIPYIPTYMLHSALTEAKKKKPDEAINFEKALFYYFNAKKASLERLKQASLEKKFPFSVDKSHIEDLKEYPDPFHDEDYRNIKSSAYDIATVGARVGKNLKEYYDMKYGEKGYVIVSIGTSPAPAAKAMEYIGADVRYVPISGLGHVEIEDTAQIDKYMTQNYKDFLNSIGITKEKIESDNRHYVILDYVYSGNTLKNIDFILDKGFKIDKSKYSCDNLKEILDEYSVFSGNKYCCTHQSYIDKCYDGSIGEECGIPHINYDNLDTVKDEAAKEKTKDEKVLEHIVCYYLKN